MTSAGPHHFDRTCTALLVLGVTLFAAGIALLVVYVRVRGLL